MNLVTRLTLSIVMASLLPSLVVAGPAARSPLGHRAVVDTSRPVLPPAWPLPQREPGPLTDLDELSGVLVHFGNGDYQIESAVLQVSEDGRFGFLAFEGYDRQGNFHSFHRGASQSRTVRRAHDLTDLVIGDPSEPLSVIDVDRIELGIDGEGFLAITDVTGVARETGTYVSRTMAAAAAVDIGIGVEDPPIYICGELTIFGCFKLDCNGTCGEYPGCACIDADGLPAQGSCIGGSTVQCRGTCPPNTTCYRNGEGICGCHANP
ncbi:MAG: hypothetical protein AAF533_03275 [Acidobacteriota bacterium]